MKAAIVYNPRAGLARASLKVRWATLALRERGWEVVVKPTRHPDQMRELATTSAAEGVDAIFAAGGDGTVGAVADVICGSPTILGVLPIGTANIWAAELSLTGRMDSANQVRACVNAQLDGTVRAVDVGAGEGRKFLLWASVGLDAHVVGRIEPRPEIGKRLGVIFFYIAGLLAALDFRGGPMTIRTESGSLSGIYLLGLASNVRRYAGTESVLDPESRADDGLLEVWVMEGESYLDGLAHLIRYKFGKHRSHPKVKKIRGRTVDIALMRPMPLQFDGEMAGRVTRAHFEVCPKTVRVFVPNRSGIEILSKRS